jgi:virginiamycin A acetyltransferase
MIASGVQFIMNGANHQMDGISAYPFYIFGKDWASAEPALDELPYKGDTVVEHDVWIGHNVTIMPGVRIGSGAIISTNSTVTKDVSPYTIVGGNPAKVIRERFSDERIAELLALEWWNWDLEKITANLDFLTRK